MGVIRLALLSVFLAIPASAERWFAAERGLVVAAVPNAARYRWEITHEPADGWRPLAVSTAPSIRIRPAWRERVRVQVRAVAADGTEGLPCDVPSETAIWHTDPDCDGDGMIGGPDFSCFRRVFGMRNCAGEWTSAEVCP